ncbi:UNVERIFIED_CONTAM: muramoyltetrapeptide carboxypeptidase [Brevibacillus sp. OAP136]
MKLKPAALQAGDTIGIVAPASWPNAEKGLRGAKRFEQRGIRVEFGTSLSRQHGYLGGTDQERVDELHQMFANPAIKGIFCACGGYGTGRIASMLDYDLIRQNPKIFWGYSDITFLLNAFYQKAGLVTFHGPMLSSDIGQDDVHPLTLDALEQAFAPIKFTYTEDISPLRTLVEGEATGEIVGGNLSLLTSGIGTEFEIDTKGKLLLIEEVDEDIYRVDRMLNQLKMAGKFDDAAGVLLADFKNCEAGKRSQTLSLEQVFIDHIQPAGKPVLSGFLIGHCSPNFAIPIGAQGTMNTYKKSLLLEESGVRA